MAGILVLSYRLLVSTARERRLVLYLVIAKALQSISWLLLFFRDFLPDLLSVNLGNSLLFTGFFYEAQVTLSVLRIKDKKFYIVERILLGLSLLIFNVAEIGHNEGLRGTIALACIFFILFIPSLLLVFIKGSSVFKRITGIIYIVFLLSFLFQVVQAMPNDRNLFSETPVQAVTYLALVTILIYSLVLNLLLAKDESDKELYAIATTDYLTQLNNRRAFLDRAEGLFNQYQRSKQAFAILFLDIDHFKAINDKYGHATGDVILIKLGDTIKNSLRKGDLICRYGGEEFLIFLPLVTAEAVYIVVERLMSNIRAIRLEDHNEFRMTASIGVAYGIPGSNNSLDAFIHIADEAMYEAKNTGRNRFVFRSLPSA
jgi:diguanylate cyclase (GGDEF)-like protein